MNKPRISVIVPVKDTLPYFKKCYDSLVHQTCKDVEIVIIDDASSQNIRDAIQASIGTPMRDIIYKKNSKSLGPGACRNLGLALSHGEYIAFCDSDDWVDLSSYKYICDYLDQSTTDIAMFSMKREYPYGTSERSNYLCYYDQIYTLTPEIAIRSMCGEYEDMGIKVASACMNKVFRRDFLTQINARFEENVYYQGTMFCVYTFLRANKIDCLPRVTYHHFRRRGSIIQSFNSKHIHDFRVCCQTIKKYFSDLDKLDIYQSSLYRKCAYLFDLNMREIFQYVYNEEDRKFYIQQLLKECFEVVSPAEWLTYLDSETIRRHLQPGIDDTSLY